jgi:hypothetical protein
MNTHQHASDCGCALPRELPKIQVGTKVYYVDARLRQFRNVENPHDYLDYGDDLMGGIAELEGRQ